MLHRTIVPSPKGALSLHDVLQLTNIYLENASRANNNNVALVLCQNAEAALSQMRSSSKKPPTSSSDNEQATHGDVAAAYYNLGRLLEHHGYRDEAEAFHKKCKKWGLFNKSHSNPPVSLEP
ncbi:hypothetical protein BGX31_010414 [Mortierella sp. GBA43]|nr:hypothetical protein BGX31_010414 [Mortierella sp. GBA43]